MVDQVFSTHTRLYHAFKVVARPKMSVHWQFTGWCRI